jgi:hypothetical protein
MTYVHCIETVFDLFAVLVDELQFVLDLIELFGFRLL